MAKKYTEIVGIEQLEDVLNKLPKEFQRPVLLSTTLESGKDFLAKLKSSLQAANRAQGTQNVNMEELIQRWVLKKSKTYRAGYSFGFKAMYDEKTKTNVFRKYYPDVSRQKWAILGPLWLEHGTRGIGRSGKYKDRKFRIIRPHGWFRRSVDTSIKGIENNFKAILHKKFNQALNKYIRKNNMTW